MSLTKYTALLTVIEHSNITKAAEELGYTQSGISYMIKSLETEMGFPLLIRSKEGVIPTENALKLKPILKNLISTKKELDSCINEIKNAAQDSIRIGSYNSTLLNWVPQIMKRFYVKFPDSEINLVEGSDSELEEMLISGSIDIAFTAGVTPEGFKFTKLADDPFLIIIPKGHPLEEKESIFPEDLFEYSIVLPDESYYNWFTYSMKNSNVKHTEHFKYSLKDASSIMSMVSNNLAISILPQRSFSIVPENVAVRSFADGHSRKLGITYPGKKSLSPIISEFIKTAKEVVQGCRL